MISQDISTHINRYSELRKETGGGLHNGPPKMSQSLESVNVSLYDKRDFPEIKDLEMKRLAWMVQVGPL